MALRVHLVTPEREVWTGEASFLIARAIDGDVGILPGHAPLLTALDVGAVFIDHEGTRTAVAVDGGFLHVTSEGDDTRVDVLAEHAVPQEEISTEEVANLREQAERLAQEGRSDEARAERAKATTRERLSR